MLLTPRNILGGVFLCSLIAGNAVAGDGDFTINASLGSQYFSSSVENINTMMFSLGAEYEFAPKWSAELNYRSGLSSAEEDKLSEFYLNGFRYFGENNDGWRPFLSVGGGSTANMYAGYDEGELQFNYGGGLRYYFSPNWSLKLDLRGVSGVDTGYFQVAALLGLSLSFGGSDDNTVYTAAEKPAEPVAEEVPLDTLSANAPVKNPYALDEYGRKVIKLREGFGYNSLKITEQMMQDLFVVAEVMFTAPESYALIEVHSDNVGSVVQNERLTQEQAEVIKQALVDGYGIADERIFAKGYGPHKPLTSNETPEGRKENRRIVVTVSQQMPQL